MAHLGSIHPDDVHSVTEDELDYAIGRLPKHLRMDFVDSMHPFLNARGGQTQSVDLSSIHGPTDSTTAQNLSPRSLGIFDTIEQRHPGWQKLKKPETEMCAFDDDEDDEADRTIVTSNEELSKGDLD